MDAGRGRTVRARPDRRWHDAGFTTRGKERTAQPAFLDPGRSITLRSTQGRVTADYLYACARHGEGTRVSLVAECRMTGPVRPLGPMIRSAIRKVDSGQLDTFAATSLPDDR
jgi:hypothetical protein